jgi:hypothetical protein
MLNLNLQETGVYLNNSCENSHLPFRRKERSMADLGAFFVFSATLIIYGVIKSKSGCLRAVALLLGIAALLRVLAWVAHGADLATTFIAVELVLVVWLVASAAYMDKLVQAEENP